MNNKRERRDVLLCHPFNPSVVEKWPKPVYVQPKLEGDRLRAKWDPNIGHVLYSSTANPIIFLPHLNRAVNEMNALEELDGEAYNHDLPHEMIHGIVSRTKNIHKDFKLVQFHIFDICDEEMPFKARNLWMEKNIVETEHIKKVFTTAAFTLKEINEWYEEFINTGYEGIIVRHPDAPYVRKRTPFVRKHKPLEVDIYLCVGINEETSIEGIPKGRMGSLTMMDQDKKTFKMGGWTDYQKELYWNEPDQVLGKLIRVRYQQLTEKGVPKMISRKEVLND